MTAGLPPTVPDDAPDELDGQAPPAEPHREAWALERRQAIRVTGALALLLGLLTMYFVAWNAYVLYGSSPLAYSIELRSLFAPQPDLRYTASVAWEPMPSDAGVQIRPTLSLDGVDIPSSGERVQGAPLGGGKAAALHITVPGGTGVGDHRGWITLRRAVLTDDLPDEVSIPVRVEVTGGFWSSWFIVRDWLLMMTLFMVLIYGFCLIALPAPEGMVLILVSQAGHARVRRVPLGVRKLAWLFPWKRPVVPLTWVFKRAAMSTRLKGELLFVDSTLPVLFVHAGLGPDGLGRHRGTPAPMESMVDEPFERCGSTDTMYESHTYRLSDPESADTVLIRFTSRVSHDG